VLALAAARGARADAAQLLQPELADRTVVERQLYGTPAVDVDVGDDGG
jgi:hypothetical protein